MDRRKRLAAPPRLLIESLEPRQFLSTSAITTVSPSLVISAAASASGSIQGYTPQQIKAAYGVNSISLDGVSGTGAGQTIAIVDAYSDPKIASDLGVFDKQFDLASASLTQISATGSSTQLPASDAGWDGEISLDVEWAHAIAPKAKIILVDAASDSLSSLMSAVEYARKITSVSVISMSWGGSEFSGETSYDKYFTTPSGHIGITFVAASGDEGASGGAEWPASSPDVLSVGGTTLSLSSTGAVESESAWNDSSGGVSGFESTPTYQSAVSTVGRSTPDVSYDANPNTGFAVYDSIADEGTVGWQEVGGTSAGTPQWAALISIADQGRVANGLETLDGATGTLPAIYSIYSNSTHYAADFSDITTGSSVLSGGGGGGFGGGPFGGPFGGRRRGNVEEVTATTGYDTLTGLGTPKAAALVEALASATVSKSAVVKTTTTSTKSTKTKATAAAAIQREQTASIFDLTAIRPNSLVAMPRSETDFEIQTTSATTVVAIIERAPSAGPDAVTLSHFVSLVDHPTPAAEDDAQAGTSRAVFATATSSSKHAAEPTVDRPVSQLTSLPAIFSEMAIARDFREALTQFADERAPIPAATARSQDSPSFLANGVGLAMDAVLIGYFYNKRKRFASSDNVFISDGINLAANQTRIES